MGLRHALRARKLSYKLRVVINWYNSVRNTNTDQKIAEVLHSLSYIFYHFHGWHVDAYLDNNKHWVSIAVKTRKNKWNSLVALLRSTVYCLAFNREKIYCPVCTFFWPHTVHEGKNTGIKVAGNQALCREGGLCRGVREGRGVIGGRGRKGKYLYPFTVFFPSPSSPSPFLHLPCRLEEGKWWNLATLFLVWEPKIIMGRDPFNQTFRKFRSKTQWIGSVQLEKFRKNGSTFWGGPLFSVGPVWILVEWIAPMESSRNQLKDAILNTHIKIRHGWFFIFFPVSLRNNTNWYIMYHTSCVTGKGWLKNNNPFRNMRVLVKISTVKW